ncbi:MAG TPA: hypothetical protein VFC84_02470 [Desulfosporosinus sp.]|nr:hypothetical protein [Desulfosporosinus sp.]
MRWKFVVLNTPYAVISAMINPAYTLIENYNIFRKGTQALATRGLQYLFYAMD